MAESSFYINALRSDDWLNMRNSFSFYELFMGKAILLALAVPTAGVAGDPIVPAPLPQTI